MYRCMSTQLIYAHTHTHILGGDSGEVHVGLSQEVLDFERLRFRSGFALNWFKIQGLNSQP